MSDNTAPIGIFCTYNLDGKRNVTTGFRSPVAFPNPCSHHVATWQTREMEHWMVYPSISCILTEADGCIAQVQAFLTKARARLRKDDAFFVVGRPFGDGRVVCHRKSKPPASQQAMDDAAVDTEQLPVTKGFRLKTDEGNMNQGIEVFSWHDPIHNVWRDTVRKSIRDSTLGFVDTDDFNSGVANTTHRDAYANLRLIQQCTTQATGEEKPFRNVVQVLQVGEWTKRGLNPTVQPSLDVYMRWCVPGGLLLILGRRPPLTGWHTAR